MNAASKVTEYAWNSQLADMIESYLVLRANIAVHRVWRPDDNSITQLLQRVNATRADCYVELHLNAANERASGTEMLYWHNSGPGRRLAELLQSNTVAVLGLPSRGVKARTAKDRGSLQLRASIMPSVLTESFFIDNDSDLARGTARMDALAEAQALAIEKFLIMAP